MSDIKIFNEDCFVTMERIEPKSIDLIMTSPFYNTDKHAGRSRTIKGDMLNQTKLDIRYDEHIDNMTNDEYCEFTTRLFNSFDKILKANGCILYNISYGAENTEGLFRAINSIIVDTNFTVADVICWMKKSALPNNVSSNKLTRIWEFVFVICRKSEFYTFFCNKKVKNCRKTGQKNYENIFNVVEARNNDGFCPYNRATYSSELCEKLFRLYAPENAKVYDPFCGTGTTGVACKRMRFDFIGSEISENQCKWANDRIQNTIVTRKLF